LLHYTFIERETLSVLTFKDNIDYYNWFGFANQESKTLHGPYVGAEDHSWERFADRQRFKY
jgi:hypothetical protein